MLRDYQKQAVASVQEEFRKVNSTLLVMPTGTGKTIVFLKLIAERLNEGRAMIIAHRAELIFQAAAQCRKVLGFGVDIEMADYKAARLGMFRSPIVVSTVQTQTAGRRGFRRMGAFDATEFATLVIDEAHHAPAKSYRALIDYYRQNDDLKVLGVTATPDRKDKTAMANIFDTVAINYPLIDAIQDGWLVPIEQQFEEIIGVDFAACKTIAGDWCIADLERQLIFEKPLMAVAKPAIEQCGDRPAIIYTVSCKHAERLTEIINRSKPGSAFVITQHTPSDRRAEMMKGFRERRYQYMVNVDIATEGFDVPHVEVIIQARPTKSRARYAQMIGRGTRPVCPELNNLSSSADRRAAILGSVKPFMLVIDFTGNTRTHGRADRPINAIDILGGNMEGEIADLARLKAQQGEKPVDVLDALAVATIEARELKRQREETRRARIDAKVTYRTYKVDAFGMHDLPPDRSSDTGAEPLSQKQADWLSNHRINTDGMSKVRATQLIGVIMARAKNGQCSPRQARMLEMRGYDTTVSRKEASRIIDQIAKKEGWKKR